MADTEFLAVEVVFATPVRQHLIALSIPAGTSCAEAVRLSGIVEKFPDNDIDNLSLAVWGRGVPGESVPQSGDRIEILRPLQIDPREARRQLAAEGQFMGNPPADSVFSEGFGAD